MPLLQHSLFSIASYKSCLWCSKSLETLRNTCQCESNRHTVALTVMCVGIGPYNNYIGSAVWLYTSKMSHHFKEGEEMESWKSEVINLKHLHQRHRMIKRIQGTLCLIVVWLIAAHRACGVARLHVKEIISRVESSDIKGRVLIQASNLMFPCIPCVHRRLKYCVNLQCALKQSVITTATVK